MFEWSNAVALGVVLIPHILSIPKPKIGVSCLFASTPKVERMFLKKAL